MSEQAATRCELCLFYFPGDMLYFRCNWKRKHPLCDQCFDKYLKNADQKTWPCPCETNKLKGDYGSIWKKLEKL